MCTFETGGCIFFFFCSSFLWRVVSAWLAVLLCFFTLSIFRHLDGYTLGYLYDDLI